MSKRSKKRRPKTTSTFKLGDLVRVKHGVRDEEYADLPLGGWAGTITAVHSRRLYTVRWNRQTLASIHPIFFRRCQLDGTVAEEYFLRDDDLQADSGGPLEIEQPEQIVPRPLSPKNQLDRVRSVFGLTSDEGLPNVEEAALATYYDYLAEVIRFPFEARWLDNYQWSEFPIKSRQLMKAMSVVEASVRQVRVVALDEEFDTDEGIFCKVVTARASDVAPLTSLQLPRAKPNHQPIDDYTAWFFGELATEDEAVDAENKPFFHNELGGIADARIGDDEPGGRQGLAEETRRTCSRTAIIVSTVALAISYGAVVGSAVAVIPWAKWAAAILGGSFGLVGAFSFRPAEQDHWRPMPRQFRNAVARVPLFTVGALIGVFVGIAIAAMSGALGGAIVGLLLRRLPGKHWLSMPFSPSGVLVGVAGGVATQAVYLDAAQATAGLVYGALTGLGAGLFLFVVILPLAQLKTEKKSV